MHRQATGPAVPSCGTAIAQGRCVRQIPNAPPLRAIALLPNPTVGDTWLRPQRSAIGWRAIGPIDWPVSSACLVLKDKSMRKTTAHLRGSTTTGASR
ncbi:MAG: hypothetical protein GDA56_20850 [Hormoscilla sp. GM7CHS1pb]|nr:hypothetical protein [Hormoscilla sp. GM7CHS1pb]